MEKYLTYVIPLLSIALTYWLGRLQTSKEKKSDSQRERYLGFYVPFIQLLYCGRLDAQPYSSLDLKTRAKYFDLVFQNLHLIDATTQSHVIAFHQVFVDTLDISEATPDAITTLDNTFNVLTDSVLLESVRLSKSLRLPPIAKSFSREYQKRKY